MSDVFYTEGKLDIEWLDSKARNKANELKYLKPNQLRNFYGEFKRIQNLSYDDFYNEILPLLKLIKAKANYRSAKKQRGWDFKFDRFLQDLIDSIKDKKTFDNACMVFEAVVGFFPKQ
ncbi:type III-A CRISPR-associated protein Csm2 [bacterium]|nr:MAG: type III-A CRISPR-associated protein Csm2 [bacterium]